MWKHRRLFVVSCSKITEFATCKYVVLNVETVIKTKNSAMNNFLFKSQITIQVLGLGYPQGEQILPQTLVPILSCT